MKTKKMLALLAGMMLLSGSAYAFHGGGVAHCDGCHSMHNSADNPRAGSATAADLMKGSDASSTCLNCHKGTAGSYHVMTAMGGTLSSGGDFFWVSDAATYTIPVRGNPVTSLGANHGHSVVALDFGLAADAANGTAPGGTMNSGTLGCTSCHDPHGQVDGGTGAGAGAIVASGSYGADASILPAGEILGNYRLLGDDGYKLITANAPVARADGSTGKVVDYGSGMSDWCLSCHAAFADNSIMHPTDVPVPLEYNSYVATGDYTGTVATAYDALVPFETGATAGSALKDVKALAAIDGTTGADGNSKVMCLSCHRAHASAFNNALRWDNYSAEFVAESAILSADTTYADNPAALLAAGAIPYYKDGAAIDMVAEYGEYQRSLCNKCHVKD